MTEIILQDIPPPAEQRRFGRLVAIDERDKRPRYAMAAPPTDRTHRNWLSLGGPWDQGSTSQCVAYSSHRYLHTHPVVNRPWMPHADLYHQCQLVDEWPGEDYDGTSVRAAFKVFKTFGAVESYNWAFELEPVVRHVLEIGPVVMGTDWTDGMFDVDAHGYIWPTGDLAGGHAWLLVAVNRNRSNPDGTRGAGRLLNSWGRWGHNSSGRAWVAFHVLERLIAGLDQWPGEAAVGKEIKRIVA